MSFKTEEDARAAVAALMDQASSGFAHVKWGESDGSGFRSSFRVKGPAPEVASMGRETVKMLVQGAPGDESGHVATMLCLGILEAGLSPMELRAAMAAAVSLKIGMASERN